MSKKQLNNLILRAAFVGDVPADELAALASITKQLSDRERERLANLVGLTPEQVAQTVQALV